MGESDKRLLFYKAVPLGAAVVFVARGCRRGQRAVVTDKLDNLVTGMARYQVEISDGARWDVCRHELSVDSRITGEKRKRRMANP